MTMRRILGAMLVVLIAWSANTWAATPAPSTQRLSTTQKAADLAARQKAAQQTLQQATAALVKEYQDYLKTPSSKIRTDCDFFAKNPELGSKMTPEAIIGALERPYGTDVRVDCYVKWQLLSGIAGKVPDNLAARGITIYTSIHALQPMPGGPGEAAQLDATLRRGGTVDQLNKQWQDRRKATEDFNLTNEKYRSQLYSMLPGCVALFRAGFSDAYTRACAGANGGSFAAQVMGGIRTWAVSGAAAADVKAVAGIAAQVGALARDDKARPEYYTGVESKDNQLKWKRERSGMGDPKSYDELAKYLAEKAANPTGGLKFKD